jgi:endonuclease/exonuclease/phosphatase family metal-dependent hydrolase
MDKTWKKRDEYFNYTSLAVVIEFEGGLNENELEELLRHIGETPIEYNESFVSDSVYLNLFSWNWDCKNRKDNDLTEEKINLIKELQPDIAVLQECNYYDCLRLKKEFKNAVWYGDGKDSEWGIGMFSDTWTFELPACHSYNTPFRYVVPYYARKDDAKVIIFSVWTKNCIHGKLSDGEEYYDTFHNLKYAENFEKAIDFYKDLLKEPVIFIGDFNSGDTQQNRSHEHLRLIQKLAAYNIFNCTKLLNGEYNHDFEFIPTYYPKNNPGLSYIDDYCFISRDEQRSIDFCLYGFGIPEKWTKYSDHIPLILEMGIKKKIE